MTHDPNLYSDGAFAFIVDAVAHHTDTGWHWPALLRVTMNRRDALHAMQYLLAQIADSDREDLYELTWSGSIVRENEEGEPINLHLTDQQLYTTVCQAYLVLQSHGDDPASWGAWRRAMETVERGEGA
jgi:hypothetical protein